MDRQRGSVVLQGSNQALAELQRQAEDLRDRYKSEGNRLADALHVPTPSEAVQQAHLDTDVPVGDGALAALLDPGKDPQLNRLNGLRDQTNAGNAGARAESLALLAALTPAQLALYGALEPGRGQEPHPCRHQRGRPGGKELVGGARSRQQSGTDRGRAGISGNLNGVPYADRAKANKPTIDAVYNDPGSSRGNPENP